MLPLVDMRGQVLAGLDVGPPDDADALALCRRGLTRGLGPRGSGPT
jgi:hypothetical protein